MPQISNTIDVGGFKIPFSAYQDSRFQQVISTNMGFEAAVSQLFGILCLGCCAHLFFGICYLALPMTS